MERWTLAELRHRHGMTQLDLARRLGVTPAAVANWEAGHRAPRLHMAKRIAAMFGVPVEAIVFPAEERERHSESA